MRQDGRKQDWSRKQPGEGWANPRGLRLKWPGSQIRHVLSHWVRVRRQAGWSSAAEATPQELGTGRGVLTALSWTACPSSRSIWTACPFLSTTILKASAPRPLSSLVLAVLLLLSPLTFRVNFFMKCLLYSYLQNSPEERNAIKI